MQKFKVLHIIKTMDIGGAERIVFELSKHLVHKYDITILSSGGIFCVQLENLGVKCINRNIADYNSLQKIIGVYKIIKDVLSSESFQIVHTHHRIFQFLTQICIGKNTSVYNAHNVFLDFNQLILFQKVLISCSNFVKNSSRDLLSKKYSQVVINNGVDKITKSTASISELVFVGRLTKEKGIVNLLSAIELLIKENSSFKLKIVSRQNSIINEELIKSLRLEKNVTFYNPTIDLKSIYAKSGILVLPSEVPEGLPVSILEAMVNNVLVLSTNVGGISEILHDKRTGFILENSQPETIKNKLKEITNEYSETEIEKIKNNAAKLVNQNYSLQKMIKEYDQVYSKYLEI